MVDSSYNSGKIDGLMEGLIEGKRKGKIEIAKRMRAEGISKDLIQRITGLKIDGK
jgi:predicted transposase YdaD